jgi:hypothetical protein
MNIKHALLAALIATSMAATTNQYAYSYVIDDEQQEENYLESYDDEQQEDWFESCAAPCATGGVVGLISGKISMILCKGSFAITTIAIISTEDITKQSIIGLAGLSAIIGTLVAENALRANCVDYFNKKFKKSGIQPDNLIKNSARIASWIGFLFV